MLGGYTRRVLRVNLSTGNISQEILPEEVLRKYIGGVGLAGKIFMEEASAQTTPLSPDNPLIFAVGPFTGTGVPTSGRHAVVARSPLTGIWGEADVGGKWGKEFKWAGYDVLVVTGSAAEPVYLSITNDKIEIRNASHLWGKDTFETNELLKGEAPTGAVSAVIGPAGERLVKFASIMHDGKDSRAAGRTGLGAVMGSKKLKAIVVKGATRPSIFDAERLNESIKSKVKMIQDGTVSMRNYGTSGGALGAEALGDLPIKNWQEGSWPEGAKKICGQSLAESYLTGNYRCFACVIGCGREVKVNSERYGNIEGSGPEYETVGSLGAMCLIDDLEAIVYGNELCNRLGLDTISTGGAVAFAMEAYERGLITEKDTGGIKIEWGNPDSMIELIRQIGFCTGIGSLLGEGVKSAAEKLGGLALEFAIHVKGLEFPAHDPRAFNSLALTYATSNRGACHLQGFSHTFEKGVTMPQLGILEGNDRFKVEGKGPFTAKLQDLCCMFDSLKLCKFIVFGGIKVDTIVEWLNYVVGWDMSIDEFLLAGERIFNLKRIFNNACSISRKDDTLPPRILSQKRRIGGAADNLPPLGRMLSEYYDFRGWDDEGIPTKDKILKLGLQEFIK